tara:strand:- start:555 stop:719 length:165 start_codon:yes stop_codon:yes gene_type:complete
MKNSKNNKRKAEPNYINNFIYKNKKIKINHKEVEKLRTQIWYKANKNNKNNKNK